MKKYLASWMVVMCAGMVVAESQESRLNRLSQKIKLKFVEVKDTTSAFTAATMAYCQNVLHKMREPNDVVIDNAQKAMQSLSQIVSVVSIGVHTEIELFENVKALHFDASNATKALDLLKDVYLALAAFEKRYNGILTPWNRSKKMRKVAIQVLREVKNAELYKLYFESHSDCLLAWELGEKYQIFQGINCKDEAQVVTVLQNAYQQETKYFLIYAIKQMERDIKIIKNFISNVEYMRLYVHVHRQLQDLLVHVDQAYTVIKNGSEYKKQVAQQLLETNRA